MSLITYINKGCALTLAAQLGRETLPLRKNEILGRWILDISKKCVRTNKFPLFIEEFLQSTYKIHEFNL